MALSSLEKIKDYSVFTASEEVNTLFALVKADPSSPVDSKSGCFIGCGNAFVYLPYSVGTSYPCSR